MALLQYGQSSPGVPYGTASPVGSGAGQVPLFGIQIGLDTTNNFALSVDPDDFEVRLAVKTPNGRYVTKERKRERLIDVTAFISNANPFACRLPVEWDEVHEGDLIVTADPPNFSALYVLTKYGHHGKLLGLDTGSSQITDFALPDNPFLNFFVRVVSVVDLLAG